MDLRNSRIWGQESNSRLPTIKQDCSLLNCNFRSESARQAKKCLLNGLFLVSGLLLQKISTSPNNCQTLTSFFYSCACVFICCTRSGNARSSQKGGQGAPREKLYFILSKPRNFSPKSNEALAVICISIIR